MSYKFCFVIAVTKIDYELSRTIESILSQEIEPNIEVLIRVQCKQLALESNGAETEFWSRFKVMPNGFQIDLRIEPDSGLYNALNRCLLPLEKRRWYVVLGQGDLLCDSRVIKDWCTSIDQADDRLMLIYADLLFFKRSQKKGIAVCRRWTAKRFKPWKVHLGWAPPHLGLLVKGSMFNEVGVFNEKMKISADYDWLVRALTLLDQKQIFYIGRTLVAALHGGVSTKLSIRNIFLRVSEDYLALRHFPLPLVGLVCKRLMKIGQFFCGKKS